MQTDLETLKTQLADSAARSDIECYTDRNEGWHNLRSVDRDQVECVQTAIHYLTMRGLLEIHPGLPELVRILDPEKICPSASHGLGESAPGLGSMPDNSIPGVDDLDPEVHA